MATSVRQLNAQHKASLDENFIAAFGTGPERYFSAPGRTEIGGNHTDHQRGRVLAAAVELDVRAAVKLNGLDRIRFCSDRFSAFEIKLDEPEPREEEKNTAPALLRAMAAGFAKKGCSLSGFDIYCETDVLPGSGLSSSAAFEVLAGTVINSLFFEDKLSAEDIAKMGQWAENEYFGKPCGLMDQMACAVGNLVAIDFFDKEQPSVKAVNFDFSSCGHALCIIDSRASHAELTHEYAAIPNEMKAIAGYFGKEVLSQLVEEDFYAALPRLRESYGDRAVLRAIHFFGESKRAALELDALEKRDFEHFLQLVRESGRSSWMYLQNVMPCGAVSHQEMAIALALCDRLLEGEGAFRVHGGGFAGTVQAFVPMDRLPQFKAGIDAVLGEGACRALSIRKEGGCELL